MQEIVEGIPAIDLAQCRLWYLASFVNFHLLLEFGVTASSISR